VLLTSGIPPARAPARDPSDVGLIGPTELNLHLEALVGARVSKNEIEPAGLGLDQLLLEEDQISEAQDTRVLGDAILEPALIELGMAFERDALRLGQFHVSLQSMSIHRVGPTDCGSAATARRMPPTAAGRCSRLLGRGLNVLSRDLEENDACGEESKA